MHNKQLVIVSFSVPLLAFLAACSMTEPPVTPSPVLPTPIPTNTPVSESAYVAKVEGWMQNYADLLTDYAELYKQLVSGYGYEDMSNPNWLTSIRGVIERARKTGDDVLAQRDVPAKLVDMHTDMQIIAKAATDMADRTAKGLDSHNVGLVLAARKALDPVEEPLTRIETKMKILKANSNLNK